MDRSLSRRHFVTSAAVAALATAPAFAASAAAGDQPTAMPLVLRCSLETPPSHTRNAVIRDYLGKIEAAAGGRIKTQLYESGQLFPDLLAGKALLQHQIEMAVPGSWSLTGVVPDADFLQLPAMYGRSLETVHQVVDGAPGWLLGQKIEQQLNAHVIGSWLDLGFFNWYSTSRPLNSYADLKGLKIRNNGGAGQAWRTIFMGAIPNTTPLPNVPLALSQGTFDGLITTHETVASGQFWESGIRHALEDHQFAGEYIPMVSLAFWHKLSPDLQQLFTAVWRDNISAYREQMAAAQTRARDVVQSHGVRIATPSVDEVAALRRTMVAFHDKVASQSRISSEMLAALWDYVDVTG
jgi:TRAP-type C4-dicarboxylate transport system substrate-binding protein